MEEANRIRSKLTGDFSVTKRPEPIAGDPHAWLSATLTAIVKGHKQSQIDDLLPWNYAATV